MLLTQFEIKSYLFIIGYISLCTAVLLLNSFSLIYFLLLIFHNITSQLNLHF